MGNGSSQVLDFWAHLATTNEIRTAARSIEAWQKAQDANRGGGGPAVQQQTTGPLLYRLGGADVVKKIVEGFYRRLYGNERLLVFLHDKDVVTLRAKQSTFMSWLFGPPSQSYSGKSLRIAHLRLIKQRGFSPQDFDSGLSCFADAMREEGAPESLINETINKIRPFKDIIFTTSARDADEEARWVVEEREREVAMQARQQQLASGAAAVFIAAGSGAGRAAASAGTGSNSRPASAAAAAAPRASQCPFTGGRLSRPGSGRVVPVSGDGTTEKAKSGDLPAPSTPPLSTQPQQPDIVLVETLPLRPSSGAPPPPGALLVRAGSPAAAVMSTDAADAVTAAATTGDVVLIGDVEGISLAAASPPLAPPGSPPLPGSRPASRPPSSCTAVSAPLPLALPPPPPALAAAATSRPQSRRSTSAAGNRPQSAAAVAAAAAVSPNTDGAGGAPAAAPARAGTDIVDAFLSEVFADESKAMVEEALAELGDTGAAAGPAAAAAAGGSPCSGTRLSTPQLGTGVRSPPPSSPNATSAAAVAAEAVTPRTATPLTAGGFGPGAGVGGRPPSQQTAKVC